MSVETGQHISHYKILEKLGAGGMGVVYKAEDTKLKRTVALKFLPPQVTRDPEAKERFIHEAQAASALDHQNVCTIYEINETDDNQLFITMAYYDGETLRNKINVQRLKIKEAIDIAIQIAQGLEKAHKKGIVHRDIKPANIFLTKDGVVKILDFGLAKLAGQAQLTKDSSTLGTAAYMSPEQLSGKEIDQRSDIWSLGVVLSEMLTGELPFKGDYEQAVIYAILNEESVGITDIRSDTPEILGKIINKALAKEASERYQHIEEMSEDLKKIKTDSMYDEYTALKGKTKSAQKSKFLGLILIVTAVIIIAGYFIRENIEKPASQTTRVITETKWKNSVAVLPFRDFSPNKDQEYFCNGMTDAIIGQLSYLKQLKTISMTSVLQYKNQVRNIKKIGQELDVETILEGSIQKEGDKIRVNAQLIRVADDSHLWHKTYNRELKSIFVIQDDISQAIVNALKIELLGDEKSHFQQHHTQNMNAYDLYVQGRFFWRKRSKQGHKKSIECYKKALKIDPNYALAYAGLADSYSLMAWNLHLPREEGYTKAKESAIKAIQLNDRSAEAHTSLAFIKLEYEWDFEGAKQAFEQAIELNPGYANAYHWYARYYVYNENYDKALSLLQQALELDPLSPSINYYYAGTLLFQGRHDQALEKMIRVTEMFPEFAPAFRFLGYIYIEKSMYREAMTQFEKIRYKNPLNYEYLKTYVEIMKGNLEKLDEFINKLKKDALLDQRWNMDIAWLYAAVDKEDQVFEWLEKTYEQRDAAILHIKSIPVLNKYRTNPRFIELLKKIGLEE